MFFSEKAFLCFSPKKRSYVFLRKSVLMFFFEKAFLYFSSKKRSYVFLRKNVLMFFFEKTFLCFSSKKRSYIFLRKTFICSSYNSNYTGFSSDFKCYFSQSPFNRTDFRHFLIKYCPFNGTLLNTRSGTFVLLCSLCSFESNLCIQTVLFCLHIKIENVTNFFFTNSAFSDIIYIQ